MDGIIFCNGEYARWGHCMHSTDVDVTWYDGERAEGPAVAVESVQGL